MDFLGKILLTAIFTTYATFHLLSIGAAIGADPRSPSLAIDLVGRSTSFVFMAMAVGLTVIRLPPKSESLGWIPRIAAIAGTFMTLTLIVLPVSPIPSWAKLVATVLIMVGTGLSAYCLAWLGRSFSIDAQARRLVTTGPYGVVRHPLYVCEAITLVGIAIANLSLWSVLIVTANLVIQYVRIGFEERVLRLAFEEYDLYESSVPRLIPLLKPRRSSSPTVP